ncbi:ribulose-phosphate 3-epimerase [candidate division KSB1 bacterium]|nr:ribulose-phosphate 3-epimerase [candidate division KSB1 bacterium]
MAKIAPSILNADFLRLQKDINEAVIAGCDWIHLDVMDGHFVPKITFGPMIVEAVDKMTPVPLDVHLMVEHPDTMLSDFVQAGAENITVHYETCPHLWRTIDTIHALGARAGVTVNPATPVNLLDPILERVDLVLVMTVETGYGGQEFIPQSLTKIAWLDQQRRSRGLNFYIEVDGGIDLETAPLVVKAGADVLVVGTFIFMSDNITATVKSLRKVIGGI